MSSSEDEIRLLVSEIFAEGCFVREVVGDAPVDPFGENSHGEDGLSGHAKRPLE